MRRTIYGIEGFSSHEDHFPREELEYIFYTTEKEAQENADRMNQEAVEDNENYSLGELEQIFEQKGIIPEDCVYYVVQEVDCYGTFEND